MPFPLLFKTFGFILAVLPRIYGHAILTYPTARAGMAEDIGIKYQSPTQTPWIPDAKTMLPCDDDNFPAGPIVATFEAGQQIIVKWNITLDHNSPPGVTVSVRYSPNMAFMTLVSGADEKLSQVPVTLPANKASENAVLRWMWQSKDDGGFYVGCSDIAIVAPGTLPKQGLVTTPDSPSTAVALADPVTTVDNLPILEDVKVLTTDSTAELPESTDSDNKTEALIPATDVATNLTTEAADTSMEKSQEIVWTYLPVGDQTSANDVV